MGLAAGRAGRQVELGDMMLAMADAAGTGALERLLDMRRAQVRKDQAIAAQDYEAATRHREAERAAAAALEPALKEWQKELTPPGPGTA